MRAKPWVESSAAGCIVEEFSLLIAQLSDLHVTQPGDPIGGGNRERLEEALDTILDFGRKPDLIVVTGDIAEQGDIESYRMFIDVMTQATLPWTATFGNHDRNEAFFASLAEAPDCGFRAGRVHIFEDWALVLADTSAAPHHGGSFDEVRAAQLARDLASTVHLSTLLAIHHPPIAIGLDWIDPDPDADWIKRLGECLAGQPQVKLIICGHVHVAASGSFKETPVTICPSTAQPSWPDLSPLDRERPDGRPLIIGGPPAFALHHGCAGRVTTVFGTARTGEVLLAFGGAVSKGQVLCGLLADRKKVTVQAAVGGSSGDGGRSEIV